MRLDKWLKVSRLIKRRTVANEACDKIGPVLLLVGGQDHVGALRLLEDVRLLQRHTVHMREPGGCDPAAGV